MYNIRGNRGNYSQGNMTRMGYSQKNTIQYSPMLFSPGTRKQCVPVRGKRSITIWRATKGNVPASLETRSGRILSGNDIMMHILQS
jgi:hypothetical protein